MSLEQIPIEFNTTQELYDAYMPFLKYGGVFVRTTRSYPMGTQVTLMLTLPDSLEAEAVEGTVVWISPETKQSSTPSGVGIGFGEEKARLQSRIEKTLGSKLSCGESTFTL